MIFCVTLLFSKPRFFLINLYIRLVQKVTITILKYSFTSLQVYDKEFFFNTKKMMDNFWCGGSHHCRTSCFDFMPQCIDTSLVHGVKTMRKIRFILSITLKMLLRKLLSIVFLFHCQQMRHPLCTNLFKLQPKYGCHCLMRCLEPLVNFSRLIENLPKSYPVFIYDFWRIF